MKTENNTTGAAPKRRASRKPAATAPAPLPVAPPAQEQPPAPSLPTIDRVLRQQARHWPLQQVIAELGKLSEQASSHARVVGQWVWVQFSQPPAPELRAGLSQLGFHWSTRSQSWQHPCGVFPPAPATKPAAPSTVA